MCWFSNISMQGQEQGRKHFSTFWALVLGRCPLPGHKDNSHQAGTLLHHQVSAQTYKTVSCQTNSCFPEPEGEIRIESCLKMRWEGGKSFHSCLPSCKYMTTQLHIGLHWFSFRESNCWFKFNRCKFSVWTRLKPVGNQWVQAFLKSCPAPGSIELSSSGVSDYSRCRSTLSQANWLILIKSFFCLPFHILLHFVCSVFCFVFSDTGVKMTSGS